MSLNTTIFTILFFTLFYSPLSYGSNKHDDIVYNCTYVMVVNHTFVTYCNNTIATTQQHQNPYDMLCHVRFDENSRINVSCVISNNGTNFAVNGSCALYVDPPGVIGYCNTMVDNSTNAYNYRIVIADTTNINYYFIALIPTAIIILSIIVIMLMGICGYRNRNSHIFQSA